MVKPFRAWYAGGGSATLVYNTSTAVWAEEEAITFADIQTDVSALQKERSEFYIERMLVWFKVHYSPVTPNPFGCPVHVRMGQFNTDVNFSVAATTQAPNFDLENWARVYQEDTIETFETIGLLLDGGALVVDSVGLTATAAGIPVPVPIQKWDLDVKTRLFENGAIGFGFGPWVGGASSPANGDEFDLEYKLKFLLRKGRTS